MTLRLRLVLALSALLLAGLLPFGVITYSLYARSLNNQLDDRLESSVPVALRVLVRQAELGIEVAAPFGFGVPPEALSVPSSSVTSALLGYSELRGPSGSVVTSFQLTGRPPPDLPDLLDPPVPGQSLFLTTGSTSGAGRWRVFITTPTGGLATIVVAVPRDDVTDALRRLGLLELGGGTVLLATLGGGAWLVLRRGLRPLEEMAGTAGEISAGDLSQRVNAGGGPNEVDRLGVALNTMLDGIEAAFAEREATEQRLRQFLADASHELRTPLTSIQGFAELFRMGDVPPQADLPTILRRIEEESARMGVLVEDLLLLARLDQARSLERSPVDLTVLAADACSDAVAAAPDRRVTLDAPAPVVLAADESLLRQAVGNLVHNAVRHTPPGTPVDVSTRLVEGRGAELVVRDHGNGLDEVALAHAFDRFWQADRARSGAGAGLGLSIVAGIAAEHGGEVTAANAEGGGAVFTLRLPTA